MIDRDSSQTSQPLEVPARAPLHQLVPMLVEGLNMPRADLFGRPLHYRLRSVSGGWLLPMERSLADLGIVPGTRLMLSPRPLPRRWSRRRVITTIALVCGCAGLASGALTARAVRSVFWQRPPPAAHTTVPPAALPTRAELQLTFSGHVRVVRALTWSPDSTLLASGADDAQVLIWHRHGSVLQRIPQADALRALAWSPDGMQLASAVGGGVSFLSPLSGAVLADFAHAHTAVVSQLSWSARLPARLVSSSFDGVAIVWNADLHQPQLVFRGHTTAIEGASWASDGQTIGTCSVGGVIRVWDAASGKQIHGYFSDGEVALRAVAFAPTGTTLAAGGDDGKVRLWNGLACLVQGQGPAGPRCMDTAQRISAHDGPVRALAFSPDSRFLASGGNDGMLAVWSPQQLATPLLTARLGRAVRAVAWSPDGKQIAVAAGHAVTLWTLR